VPERGRRRRRRRALQTPLQRAAFWLGWWALCYGLWLLLVFKTEPAEFVAGALAAGLAATAVELMRSQGYVPFAGELRWLRALARIPGEVARDCLLLTAALWRGSVRRKRVKGSFRVVEFPCGADDPRSEARRGVAKWLGAVGPNTYVVGFDEERDLVLLHQLVRTEQPPNVDPGSPDA
jgi:hypothetical protein